MKSLLIIQPALGTILAIITILLVHESLLAQAWMIQKSGTKKSLHSISYCDSLHGFTVGDSGKIFRTTDGGSTWISQSNPGGTFASMRKVITINPSTAFILVNTDVNFTTLILSTTDSGSSWSIRKSNISNYRHGMSFVNENFGVVLGGDSIYRTNDGGATWQSLPAPYNYLLDVSFSDARHGMATGWFGTIVSTNDSGIRSQYLSPISTAEVQAVAGRNSAPPNSTKECMLNSTISTIFASSRPRRIKTARLQSSTVMATR